MLKVHFLEDRIAWFGKYNGYEQLTRYLPAQVAQRITAAQAGWRPRLRGKLFSLRHGLGVAPQAQVDAFARFARALLGESNAVGHLLYGEHFLRFAKALPDTLLRRSLVTLHQPYSQWQGPALRELARIPHRLFLFHPAPGTFEPHASGSQHVIRHGVDTEFYTPGPTHDPGRVLYSGVHLRNLPMLERVIERLLARDRAISIDMLVPLAHRGKDVFARLARHPRLVWHAGLDEFQLRELYRRCAAMLLPMQDSGANTAVVEALASGLPVVTTDVGGIRDYGGGTVYPLVANDDDEAMALAVQRLLGDDRHRGEQSRAARRFAQEQLAWERVVARHIAIYKTLTREATRPGSPRAD
jgi:glycosyltransferase involved in cell wall biosynthesis